MKTNEPSAVSPSPYSYSMRISGSVFEQRIDELLTEFRFLEVGRKVSLGVALEDFDETENFFGCTHGTDSPKAL